MRTPLLTASMWVRGLPARLSGKATQPPPRLVLADKMGLPGWLMLGEQPNREIAFGAVGKFWRPLIEWRDVPPADFSGFAAPGWGKIAANFSMVPYGENHTLLSYQCRTATTDPDSRRRFLRYWWLVRPFVAHIMRATLNTIKADAEAAATDRSQMMRVLVCFGSKRGGTAGLAAMIGDALTETGHDAVVRPAKDVGELGGIDAVIVAGALYANRWHRDARRFVRRNTSELRGLSVWLVSSGPLGRLGRRA